MPKLSVAMKTFVLKDGSELSMEETIVHLLKESRALREDINSNTEIINNLLIQFNYYEYQRDNTLLDWSD